MKNREQAERLAALIGGGIGKAIREHGDTVTQIRLRAERRGELCLLDGEKVALQRLGGTEFRGAMLRLMENSLYAREDELKEGFFTSVGGCRVGVCGKWNRESGMVNAGSLCIRIAREIIGCAEPLLPILQRDDCRGMLILSRPAMGKTTVLRDLARLASDTGMNAAVADERREIAACVEGVPQLNVGERTDVLDGCPKAEAIPMLIRSCAPDVLFADEIGGMGDAEALSDAVRCGVKVVATAHADSLADAFLRRGIGSLLRENVFQYAVLLGGLPRRIGSIRKINGEDA